MLPDRPRWCDENQPGTPPIDPQKGVLLKADSPVTGFRAGDIPQGQGFFPPTPQPAPGRPEDFLPFTQRCAQGALAAPVLPRTGRPGTWIPGRDDGQFPTLGRFPHLPPMAAAAPFPPAVDAGQIDAAKGIERIARPWLTTQFPPRRYAARDRPCGCGWLRAGP